jgi:hypothetical protein
MPSLSAVEAYPNAYPNVYSGSVLTSLLRVRFGPLGLPLNRIAIQS